MKTLTLAIVTTLALVGSAHAMGQCSGTHSQDKTADLPPPPPRNIQFGSVGGLFCDAPEILDFQKTIQNAPENPTRFARRFFLYFR